MLSKKFNSNRVSGDVCPEAGFPVRTQNPGFATSAIRLGKETDMRFTPMSFIRHRRSEIALAGALLAMGVMPAAAQQTNCPPGSPCAITAIDGKQLPPPPQKFEGKIGRNTAQSTPYGPASKAWTVR